MAYSRELQKKPNLGTANPSLAKLGRSSAAPLQNLAGTKILLARHIARGVGFDQLNSYRR
jgi:hypothetical protein